MDEARAAETRPGGAWDGIGRRIVVGTHRRSGTHLAIDLLRRHFPACRARKRLGEGSEALFLTLEQLGPHRRSIDEARALEILRRARRPIVKTHALAEHAAGGGANPDFARALFADADRLSVVRDGRDVLTSLHVYRRSFDPTTPADFSAFLREERDGATPARRWAADVRRDLALEGVTRLRFEDLLGDTRAVLRELGRRLGMEPAWVEPLVPRPVRGRWGSRVRRLFARAPQATTVPAGALRTPRRPWRAVFTPADRALFQREAGDLLVELGYEPSDAWVEDAAA